MDAHQQVVARSQLRWRSSRSLGGQVPAPPGRPICGPLCEPAGRFASGGRQVASFAVGQSDPGELREAGRPGQPQEAVIVAKRGHARDLLSDSKALPGGRRRTFFGSWGVPSAVRRAHPMLTQVPPRTPWAAFRAKAATAHDEVGSLRCSPEDGPCGNFSRTVPALIAEARWTHVAHWCGRTDGLRTDPQPPDRSNADHQLRSCGEYGGSFGSQAPAASRSPEPRDYRARHGGAPGPGSRSLPQGSRTSAATSWKPPTAEFCDLASRKPPRKTCLPPGADEHASGVVETAGGNNFPPGSSVMLHLWRPRSPFLGRRATRGVSTWPTLPPRRPWPHARRV